MKTKVEHNGMLAPTHERGLHIELQHAAGYADPRKVTGLRVQTVKHEGQEPHFHIVVDLGECNAASLATWLTYEQTVAALRVLANTWGTGL